MQLNNPVISDEQAMQMAIVQAQKGYGFTSPNPLVGCVVLNKDRELIASGFHAQAGQAHAEVDALNKIADVKDLAGASVFVTLEPCAHFGRTPPCADRLASLPLARVIYGQQDSNPLVRGKGLEKIKRAGIQVEHFQGLKAELSELTEVFFTNINKSRSFVHMKVASSLDGCMALLSGESQWITGPIAREKSQYLRAGADAICVGAGTVIADNPQLNLRLDSFKHKDFKLVLIDPKDKLGKVLPKLKLFNHFSPKKIWLVKPNREPQPDQLWELRLGPQGENELLYSPALWHDPSWCKSLLETLLQNKIHSLFLEGGAYVIGRFLESHCVDRLSVFYHTSLLGAGQHWGDGLSVDRLQNKISIVNSKFEALDSSHFWVSGRLSELGHTQSVSN